MTPPMIPQILPISPLILPGARNLLYTCSRNNPDERGPTPQGKQITKNHPQNPLDALGPSQDGPGPPSGPPGTPKTLSWGRLGVDLGLV